MIKSDVQTTMHTLGMSASDPMIDFLLFPLVRTANVLTDNRRSGYLRYVPDLHKSVSRRLQVQLQATSPSRLLTCLQNYIQLNKDCTYPSLH